MVNARVVGLNVRADVVSRLLRRRVDDVLVVVEERDMCKVR